MHNYYLNTLGVACALGNDLQMIAQRLLNGDMGWMSSGSPWLEDYPSYFGAIKQPLPTLPAHLAEFDCRNNRLALLVATELQPKVVQLRKTFGAHRLGVVMGTSTSGIASGEQYFIDTADCTYSYRYQQQMAALAEFVARYLQLEGPRITLSTACSSSVNAFASARRLLSGNICDAVIVGGVDTLCGMTIKGFHALGALSAGRSKPFSRTRDGINLGEAGAMFILSREPATVRLCGIGASSDAYHMSSPEPSGCGAEAAMNAALLDAGLDASAIDYLNLHGTGTVQNDAMEALAVNRILGSETSCSSTKPLTGHTLGAAGALEAAFCWMALRYGNVPLHRFDGEYDQALAPLKLVLNNSSDYSPMAPPQYAMSNSFAFGGNNCTLILGTGR